MGKVKKKGKFGKALLTILITAGLAGGAYYGYTYWKDLQAENEKPPIVNPDNGKEDEGGNENLSPNPSNPEENENPSPTPQLTFAEFMADHSDKAVAFVETFARASIVKNSEVLSSTWGFHANSEGKLDSLSLTYTYKSNDTVRTIEVANMTFTNPIDLQKIVDGTTTENDRLNTITRETAFTFDARESYMDGNIADAVFAKFTNEANKRYFKEVSTPSKTSRKFAVAEETSTAIKVWYVTVEGTTDTEIIENLKSPSKYTIVQQATYPIGDNNSTTISKEVYEDEVFPIENVSELVSEFGTAITDTLNTHYFEKSAKAVFTRTFDKTKPLTYTWDIETGKEIEYIKFIGTYSKSNTNDTYGISKCTFATPIKVSDLTRTNIDSVFANAVSGATFKSEYSFSYNPTVQGTRDNLVNAIFEAYGMSKECPEGAKRYFVDDGSYIDSTLGSEAKGLTVAQIEKDKVKQFRISIKYGSTDEELIEKLKTSSNFRVSTQKSQTMNGEKLVAVASTKVNSIGEVLVEKIDLYPNKEEEDASSQQN